MPALLKTTQIQEPSSASVNLTLDTSGNGTFAGTSVMSSPYTMRNKIINGAMVIDQRNAGASVTANDGTFPLDRWKMACSQTSKLTAQQNAGSVTTPAGFTNYLGLTSSSSYAILTGDYFSLLHQIEGFNVADLAWGTASAISVNLSFWVRSSLTGTFGGALRNSAANRAYPFTYTISSANTWEQKTITILGDTTGTWLTNNGIGVSLSFGLGVGSTYSGTAGSWSANNYLSATGATSVVGTNGATFYITGVQLERGTVATPFEYRNYQQELAMCQRYYQQWGGTAVYERIGMGQVFSTTQANIFVFLLTAMRSTPTISSVGNLALLNSANGIISATSITADMSSPQLIHLTVTVASGLVAGNVTQLCANNSIAARFNASAEL